MPKYLKYIRTLPCVVCVAEGNRKGTTNIEAAHVRFISPSGLGLKPCDSKCVPLCGTHHRAQHRRGEELWWESKELDPREITDNLWDIYNKFENPAKAWMDAILYVESIHG